MERDIGRVIRNHDINRVKKRKRERVGIFFSFLACGPVPFSQTSCETITVCCVGSLEALLLCDTDNCTKLLMKSPKGAKRERKGYFRKEHVAFLLFLGKKVLQLVGN